MISKSYTQLRLVADPSTLGETRFIENGCTQNMLKKLRHLCNYIALQCVCITNTLGLACNTQSQNKVWLNSETKYTSTQGSLANHTLHKEEGSGHAAADKLSPRNAIIKQCSYVIRCWYPLNVLWHIATPWQWMQSTKSADPIIWSKCLSWQNSMVAAWPDLLLSAKGVACKTNTLR